MTDSPTRTQPGNGWLGTWVFIFTALYFHLSAGGLDALLSVYAMIFIAVGIIVAALLIDFPAQVLQLEISRRIAAASPESSEEQQTGKARAIGTFIKAGQVVLAFVATKYLFAWFYVTVLGG